MDKAPGVGFKKLNFLLSSGTFPPETFANLLLLYCAPQHGFLDLAADVMAENPDYCSTLLSKVSAASSQQSRACWSDRVFNKRPANPRWLTGAGQQLTLLSEAAFTCLFFSLLPATQCGHGVLVAFLHPQDLADLLQCLILRKQQPEAALQQLDELAGRHIEGLRALTKSLQDVRLRRDNDGIRAAIQQYDDALERYVPGEG